jgi:hypothetical protein
MLAAGSHGCDKARMNQIASHSASHAALLAPVFVQVSLTFVLLFWMGRARFAAHGRGEVRIGDVALGQKVWPPKVQQIANAFHNQLELPLFFYVLVAFALITQQAGMIFVALSWIFVASRIAHAYIHATSNNVRHRFTAYLVGVFVLMAMWIGFAFSVLIASP